MKAKDIDIKITNALLELMDEQDYDSISITDITNKAGLSRVTYYRHFESKEDILIKYFVLTKDKFVDQVKLVGAKDNEAVIINLFYYFKSNLKANKSLRKAHLDGELLKFLSIEFLDYLPVKLDKYTAYFIAGALYNVLVNWLDNDCKDPVDEVSKPFLMLEKVMAYLMDEKKENK